MKTSYIISIMALTVLVSCSKKAEMSKSENDSTYITITKEQFSANGLELGTLSDFDWQETVKCKATVAPLPTGKAMISTPVSGTIKSVNIVAGDHVNKGQILCTVTGNAFLSLQQEFAEAAVQYRLNQKEYERNKSLFDQKIGSEKEFLQIESNYKISKAKYETLLQKIRLMNLSETRIEKGNLYDSFNIISPISGNVSVSEVALGKNVDEQMNLYEIVDMNQLVLSLQVFETDMSKIKTGQKVNFHLASDKNTNLKAEIYKTGKTVDPETKSVLCLARIIQPDKTKLLDNSYSEAEIIVKDETLKGLPTDAIVKAENKSFVLCLAKEDQDNYYMTKKEVVTGNSSPSDTEITDGITTEKVLTKGAFNLITE